MQLVSTVTIGAGGASSITFSSIPQDGTDLLLVISGRSANADSSLNITFNNSTSNISMRRLSGYGSSVDSGTSTSQVGNITGSDYTANTFGNMEIYVSNYTGSIGKTFSSTGISENNASLGVQNLVVGIWNNSAAVTSISLVRNMVQHSTASLYKITKA